MHILFLDGTGWVGRSVIQQALAAGHHVAALVHDPGNLKETGAALTVAQGIWY